MAHVSLYRKYRSQTFAEVIGQDHITTTLANALSEDRLHHAYLFTGPRGTGKTSTARILAKSVNCVHGPTPEPCNACEHCVAITRGSSVDVIEIDAASHGGVEDVRDLRDRVAFAPASARRKVYIVDECHMLSTQGWNAFLKTVEEPPGHVLFVFATTEPHKVLATILSRTQRFDFKRIPADVLLDHCRRIAELEGLTVEPGAMDLVVRAGDGSARDTLSVLDQVIAFTGRQVTLRGVAEVLGTVADELLVELADDLSRGDVPAVCSLIGRLVDGGQDLRQFARDAVEHLRSLLLLRVAPDAGLVDATPERLAILRAQADVLGQVELLRAIELLGEAQAQMRRGNTRLPLEVALIKSALPEAAGDAAALAARIDRLERRTGVDDPPAATREDAEPVGTPEAATAPSARQDAERVGIPEATAAPASRQGAEPARTPEATAGPSGAEATPAPTPEETAPPAPAGRGAGPATAPEEVPPPGRRRYADPTPPSSVEEAARPQAPPEGAATAPRRDESATPAPTQATEPGPAGASQAPAAAPVDLELVTRSWPAVLEAVKERSRRLHAFLTPGRPVGVEAGTLTLAFGGTYGFHAEQCAGEEWRGPLGEVFDLVLGERLRVRCVVGDDTEGPLVGEEDPDEAVARAEAEAVFETEAQEAAGELPDDTEVHDLAVQTLTRDLGATVLEDGPAT